MANDGNKIYSMVRTFPGLLCRHCVESLGTSKYDQTLSMIVRPGSNVSTIHGECTEILIQCTEKANGGIK